MSYRISKYNPKYRVDNAYLRDEWTEFSDIGHMFEEGILAFEEYEEIEKNYINFIIDICRKVHVTHFIIRNLENYDLAQWKEGESLDFNKLQQFVRDCLRNKCWGIVCSNNIRISFGYDYYIYLECKLKYIVIKEISQKYNLYPEINKFPWSKFSIFTKRET